MSAAHSAPATGVVNNFEDLRSLVGQGAVTTVALAAPDLQGRLKGKRYDADYFLDHVTTNGASVCGYVFATDWDMRALDGFEIASFDTGYGDLGLRPDARAFHQLAWQPGTILMFADAVAADGQLLDVAPRRVLARQLGLLAARGIKVQTGLEAEFVLYRGSYESAARTGFQRLRPLAQGSLDYALDHPPLTAQFLDQLQRVLAETGLPIEAIKSEGAPGQVEFTFPPGDPLYCADRHLLLKQAARSVGHDLGVAPTFMAAPVTGIGSGLHIHLSLHHDEQPLFADTEGHTSQAARQVIGGLLDALPDLAPLWAPTVNSYKRFVPGTFAPLTYSWGSDNRTCALRLAGHGRHRRIEIRLPGADANPYLALTAVLAAAQHGLDHQHRPPHPVIGNAYDTDSPNADIPRSLQAAISHWRTSPVPERLLTKTVADHYAVAAAHELDSHEPIVTSEDLRRGFSQA